MQILKSLHFVPLYVHLISCLLCKWMFYSVLLSHGVQILRMILCFREQNIFLYSWRMWKNVVFDKSYSCSAVGVMKSTARECNSIQESSIPLCLECWQTLASSLKANYNETSRDLQCYWYLSAWLYFQHVVLSCIFISATAFMHLQVKCHWLFSRMKPMDLNLYLCRSLFIALSLNHSVFAYCILSSCLLL